MKKISSIAGRLAVVAAAVIVVLAVAFLGRSVATQPTSAAGRYADAASDYAAQCARCHGRDGRAQTAKGRQTQATDLTKSSVSDEKGVRIITNGRDEMPSFKKTLSADQIQALMNYVKGFRK